MKLKNVSEVEQRVYPNVGTPFTCASGEESPELADSVAAELLDLSKASTAPIWAPTKKISKSTKGGN